MDILELLRLQQIYGQGGVATPPQIPPEEFSDVYAPQKNPMGDISFGPTDINVPQQAAPPQSGRSAIGQSMANYQPETMATDRLNKLLAEYPQYETPSKLRAVLAALSSFGPGGHETGMQVLNEPYLRKMNDWKTQIGPIQRAAELERLTNTNERTAMFQAGNQQLTAARDADKDEIARQRLGLMMSEIEKLKVKQANDMEKLMQMGGNAEALERLRQQGRLELQEAIAAMRESMAEISAGAKEDVFGQPTNIIDPNDPTKQISVVTNKQGIARPITMEGGGPAGPLSNRVSTKQPANLPAIQQQANEILSLIKTDILDKDNKLTPEVRSAVGWASWNPMGILPESDYRKGAAALNRLAAGQIIELIGELKTQSKTGATGFGQMAVRELIVLEQAASKLNDRNLDEKTVTAEIIRIKERLEQIMRPPMAAEPTVTPVNPTANDMLERRRRNRGGY